MERVWDFCWLGVASLNVLKDITPIKPQKVVSNVSPAAWLAPDRVISACNASQSSTLPRKHITASDSAQGEPMHQSYKKDACIVLNFVISVREPQITVQPAKIIIISLLHQFVWLSARRLCIHLKTYARLVHRIGQTNCWASSLSPVGESMQSRREQLTKVLNIHVEMAIMIGGS